MKFSKIVILLSLFIVTPELTVANSPHNLVENTFFKDSLVQNTEIDLRVSYGFYAHHHFEMSSYSAHFPTFEISLQKQTYGKVTLTVHQWHIADFLSFGVGFKL